MYKAEVHISRAPGSKMAPNIFPIITAIPFSLSTELRISLHTPVRQGYINVRFIGDSQTVSVQ